MIFHFEPTGFGIRIALPSCGQPTRLKESVSWIVRPAAGEHPRLKDATEIKDLVGRAVVKRAGSSDERVGSVWWHKPQGGQDGAGPEQYVIELKAPEDVFARIAELAHEGKPPRLELEPDGSGRVWNRDVDPQITIKSWRADVEVTPDEDQDATTPPSLMEAQLAGIQRSIASTRVAAWVTVAAAALLILLRLC